MVPKYEDWQCRVMTERGNVSLLVPRELLGTLLPFHL
jgi:hypothetical protein